MSCHMEMKAAAIARNDSGWERSAADLPSAVGELLWETEIPIDGPVPGSSAAAARLDQAIRAGRAGELFPRCCVGALMALSGPAVASAPRATRA